ncbi:retropepsin-like aspartic protease [Phormidium sp. CCY1219]|uniref:retropepsin-like aspartic protease n=1 Tax=Phormidium sp. CCY1219 TaxID=2886104 RepID=UPI002D1F1947|nr:retropepsin-like aspartic protease [Phormidium sp. CCY1219]MEB3829201.1 retroviral-like aspartic protease family protein [Phormidium sp. CCY1219]
MKRFWKIALSLTAASVCGAIPFTHPLLASHNWRQNPEGIAVGTETPRLVYNLSEAKNSENSPSSSRAIGQNVPSAPDSLGEEMLKKIVQCVAVTLETPPQQASQEALQAASVQCLFQVVLLAPDGSIRPDANERMLALVKLTGVSLPQPVREGQATVQLQPVENQLLLSVPVTIAGQSESFLFDTGASNSMIDREIVQELGLEGTAIPNELLAYMVVGEDCSEVNATLHTLPTIAIESATVEGITGMGLPKTAIPGDMSGVIGLDFISGFDAIVNPQTLQLQLLPPSKPPRDAIPLQGRLGVMTTHVRINDRGPFTFLLDTGAELMVITQNLATQLGLDGENRAEAVEVRGFCGTELATKTRLDRVSLQQHQQQNLEAVILSPGVLEMLGVDGIVGQNFLRQYRQHWRFGDRNQLGFPDSGSLQLSPG